jgi:hypothetical protein
VNVPCLRSFFRVKEVIQSLFVIHSPSQGILLLSSPIPNMSQFVTKLVMRRDMLGKNYSINVQRLSELYSTISIFIL